MARLAAAGAVLAALVLVPAATSAGGGLVAAYGFEEGSGTTVADASGNGHTGTTSGATWSSAGKFGKALSFNGSNAMVSVPDAADLDLSTAMTVEAWVNPATVTSDWRDVVYKGNDNYYLAATTTSASKPAAGSIVGGGYAEAYGSTKLTTSTWTHLAMTYDGTAVRLFVNGTQVASTAKTGTIASSTNPLQIGGDSIYGQFFSGLIDEVRIYDVALTATQIQADMAAPVVSGGGDGELPSAPGTLTATAAGSTGVSLSWGAATDNVGVTGYQVERCQGAGCSIFVQVGTPTGITFADSGLTAGTSYSYRVRATDAAGNLGPYGNTATATTAQGGDGQLPSAPGTLTATAAGSTGVSLSWGAATDNVGVTGYQVERCQGAGCSIFVQVGTPTGITFADSGLTAGTSYSYRVRATDAAGNLGPYGNTATATTAQGGDGQLPSAPGTLTATAAGSTGVSLSWGAATDNVGVTGYQVERCQGAGCSIFVQVGTPTGITFADSGLTAGTSYSYRVRATDAAGNLGPYGNTASATTQAAVGGLVAAYGFDEGTGTSVADASGNGHTGSVNGATWASAGKFGKALSFNGSNAIVTVPDAADLHLSTRMTLEAWVSAATVTSTWRDVIYKGNDNYYLEATTTSASKPAGGSIVGGSYAEAFGSTKLTASTWTHLAMTYDGTAVRLFVNGTQVASTAKTGTIAASTNPLQIGGDNIYGQFFSGLIDEVRIYNVALTAAQIQSDMTTPVGTGDTQVPSAPGTLTATAAGSTAVNLSWGAATDNVGVTGYRVERCQGAGCSIFVQVGTPAGTTFADSGLSPSTSYSYRVRAADPTGNLGPYGNTATVVTAAAGALAVAPKVAELTYTRTQQFTATGLGSATVTWSVDGVAGGSSATGTITAAGVYTPPSAVGTHTVTATTADSSSSANAAVYVSNYAGTFTYHNDNSRTGQNQNETILTPTNVNQSTFGKLSSYQLDGYTQASPLYVANVAIPGQGFHNVVYVATEHDSVYALDADGLTSTPLWKVSFINPAAGITPLPPADTGETKDIPNEIGITGTPVIDRSTNTIYLVAATKEVTGGTTKYVNRLHALDLATGTERAGSPVVIDANVPGTGVDAVNGRISFNNITENQRPALLLANGELYVGFANHGFNPPYHGWLMAYNATSLHQDWVWCTTPNAQSGGIWMGGDGIAADSSGSLYFTTGNGTFDQSSGGGDYGDSFVKLAPNGTVTDYFTPHDQQSLDTGDSDLASGGIVLLPDQPGAHTHEVIGGGKGGTVYVVDRDNMGHFNAANDNQIIQSLVNVFPTCCSYNTGNYSAPAYFNGTVYFVPVNGPVMAFSLTNGLLSTSPTSKSTAIYNGKTSTFSARGGTVAVSANGNSNGIVWTLQSNGDSAPGTLHAYDPTNLAHELYNSDQAGTRDQLDTWLKFTLPTVANGKVYVVSAGKLTIFGLLP